MSQQPAAANTEAYEDERIAAEVHVIRLEMAILPALRAMDAAWLAYVKEDFGSRERRLRGMQFMGLLNAYNDAYSVYHAALAAFRAVYPAR